MAALVGTQKNPVIHRYYIKLITGGKPKKLALVACMRKLLTILTIWFGVKTHWDQKQKSVADSAVASRSAPAHVLDKV